MTVKLSHAGALALLLLAPVAAAGQVAAPAPVAPAAGQVEQQLERARAEQQARVQSALALLDEVVNEAQGLKLPQNRIRVQLLAAELLWPRDQARARELLGAAANNLTILLNAVAPDDPQYANRINALNQLRQQLLQLVARRDAKLALDFLRSTRPPKPPAPAGYYETDPELALELGLAEQIVANDPEQALRLARATLSKGFASNLASLLEQVRQKDRDAADALAAEIIRKLRTADLINDRDAANVAGYLLQATQPTPPSTDGKIVNLPNPRQLRVDEQTRRELLGATTKAVLNVNAAQRQSGSLYGVISALQQSLPELERYAPAQAPALRRRLAEHEQAYNPQGALWRQYEPLIREGTVEALFAAAANAPAEIREQLYRQAAGRAFQEGGVERARELVETRVENVLLRRQLVRDFEQRQMWQAAQRGDVEQVLRLVERLPTVSERVNFLLHVARTLSDKGQADAARRLIDEAAAAAGGRARDTNQFNTQLQVAQAYAPSAPARAFEIVEARLEQLNELIAAAAVLDGFGQEQFDEDEMRLQGGTWAWLLEHCGSTLALLARTDFDRARAAADHLQRPETRLLLRLMVAQGALAEQPAR